MIDIGSYLRKYLENNHLSQDDIATLCGYSRSHFWQILQKEDMKCSMLEKICEVLEISPAIFFNEDLAKSSLILPREENTSRDLSYYKKMVTEKDARIASLEKNVELLEELLLMYRDGNGTTTRKNA